MENTVCLKGPGILKGTYAPPGDKSISHRALMFGALASGRSRFTNFLQSEDCLRTLKALRALGVPIQLEEKNGCISLDGVGMHGLRAPRQGGALLDLGNSGTSMRLLLGLLAGQKLEVTLTGDASLCSRPMKRVTEPLKKMGAQIKGKENANFAPLTIRGGKMKGIDFENRLGSAQVKSAILLAGLFAEGKTRIHEWLPSRDHTERFLTGCGARFQSDGNWLSIENTEILKSLELTIPGDISSAAFFITAAAMTPGSEITIERVGLNPTRTGLIDVLRRMGAAIETEIREASPEPMGLIRVAGRRLQGTRITKEEMPRLIDELPVLMIAMALAEGESLISGAEELRVKETDRIHSMVENLKAVGGVIEELADGCMITGVEQLKGGTVQSFGDHRTAMSFAVAALGAAEEVRIEGVDCIATSFPNFFDHFDTLRRGAGKSG